jgi:hypothetical protein
VSHCSDPALNQLRSFKITFGLYYYTRMQNVLFVVKLACKSLFFSIKKHVMMIACCCCQSHRLGNVSHLADHVVRWSGRSPTPKMVTMRPGVSVTVVV